MKKTITGHVQVDGIKRTRAFARFIQKRVEGWIYSKPEMQDIPQFDYHVIFRREGDGHALTCRLVIQTEKTTWIASRYGEEPHQTFSTCLDHLTAWNTPHSTERVPILPGLRRFIPARA